jgi:hypothetical protein
VREHKRPQPTDAETIVLVGLSWGITTAFQLQERHDLADAARALAGASGKYDPKPFGDELGRGTAILSEDPYIPVSLDHDPIVLDPFMLLRTLRDHHDWSADLVRKIERRRFTSIVLLRRLDPSDRWWRDYHFGSRVASAVASNYRLERQTGRNWLYSAKRNQT